MGMNLCRGCGLTFGSLAAFEAHRTGDFSQGERRCLTVDEIRTLGMVQNTRGWWIRNTFDSMASKFTSDRSEDEESQEGA